MIRRQGAHIEKLLKAELAAGYDESNANKPSGAFEGEIQGRTRSIGNHTRSGQE